MKSLFDRFCDFTVDVIGAIFLVLVWVFLAAALALLVLAIVTALSS